MASAKTISFIMRLYRMKRAGDMTNLIAILLLLFQPPPPVPLSASFTSSTSAVVSWQQPAEMEHGITCLRIYHVGAEWPAGICWRDLPAGLMRVELPGIYAHPAYRPRISDRIVLAFGMDDVGQATLGEAAMYRTYVPLTQQSALPVQRAVFLPVFRG
jgi:hypothetical protein